MVNDAKSGEFSLEIVGGFIDSIRVVVGIG